METITLQGRKVHVSRRAGAPTIVLVRLAARDGGIWDGLWDRLEQAFTLVNVDLGPPEGVEDDPAGALQRFADTLMAVAGEIDTRPVHLIGWTGGTQIALQAAHRHADAVASMVLIAPFRETADMRSVFVGLDLIEAFLRSGDWALYAKFWFMAGLSDRFLEQHFHEVERLVNQRLAHDPFVGMDIGRAMAWMRALRRDWFDDRSLAGLNKPTLIIGPGQNRWHAGPSRAMAEAMHQAMPGSTLHVFDDLGPLMLIEDPDGVSGLVSDFLAGHSEQP